jgi:sulfoxide reductase heme-binding subunit YedZ
VSESLTDALWYLARGTGLTALVLLTVVMVLGVGSRSGRPVFGLPRFAVAAVHRNASLIALGLVAVHMTSLFLDKYAQLRFVDLLVPFGAVYRPLWVGFGTLAADMLFVVIATSLLRMRVGVRTWRTVHWISYALWPAAWFHGFFSGTDGDQGWLKIVVFACAAVVAAAVVWRLLPTFTEAAGLRTEPRQADRPAATASRGGRHSL